MSEFSVNLKNILAEKGWTQKYLSKNDEEKGQCFITTGVPCDWEVENE